MARAWFNIFPHPLILQMEKKIRGARGKSSAYAIEEITHRTNRAITHATVYNDSLTFEAVVLEVVVLLSGVWIKGTVGVRTIFDLKGFERATFRVRPTFLGT